MKNVTYSLIVFTLLFSCNKEDLKWNLDKLPTITTGNISDISNISASASAEITNDGGATITARGVCWGTIANPTIANSFTNDSSGIGTFSSSITGLTIETTYYVRAYATNSVGTAYGNQVIFTTKPSIATLTTMSVTSISPTTSLSGGNISSDGGNAITARGVCWGTTANPTIANSFTTDSSGIGTFNSSIIGLTPATTYYVRSYATNSVGTAYGNLVSFTTTPSIGTLSTNSVTSITSTSSISGGNIISDGGNTITARGVSWGITDNPTTANSFTNDGTGIGNFTSSITGLTPATTYYVRAYATNSFGIAYGNQVSFTTTPSLATLSTNPATSITTTSATIGGNISNDGGAPVTARGVCFGTTANPTLANGPYTIDGTGLGTFASNQTGFKPSQTWYVRAYATNSVGTAYGNQVSFTTDNCMAPAVSIYYTTSYSYVNTYQGVKYYNVNMCGIVSNQGDGPITSISFKFDESNPPVSYWATLGNPGVNIPFCKTPTYLFKSGTYYLQIEGKNQCGGETMSSVQQIVLP